MNDILMCAAWLAACATSGFDITFARLGALDPVVTTTLTGFKGTAEQKQLILKVSTYCPRENAESGSDYTSTMAANIQT